MQTRIIGARSGLRRLGLTAAAILIGAVGITVTPTAAQAASGRAAIVDQRHGIRIFSLAAGDWTKSRPVWSWSPGGSAAWNNLSDVKFRAYGGRDTVLVTASGGRAATVDYATKRVTWSASPGGNPHSIELLPSGAVVVASSAGKLTTYGKGKTSGRTYSFPGAHGVFWDPAVNLLWAFGGSNLCSYHVGGSASSPTLTGKSCRSTPSGGHDLSPVYGNTAGLWLSTTRHVYTYDINRNALRTASGSIDNPSIKSVGNQPGGLVITTRVTKANSDGTWGDGNVWLYKQDGSYVGHRFVRGAAIYKARPVVWSYR